MPLRSYGLLRAVNNAWLTSIAAVRIVGAPLPGGERRRSPAATVLKTPKRCFGDGIAPGEGAAIRIDRDPSPDLLRKSTSPNGTGEPPLPNQIKLISSFAGGFRGQSEK